MSDGDHPEARAVRWPLIVGAVSILMLYSIAYFRTAWVSEDAFITFRVVDNTLRGHGLTWNPGERVQVYTHPAWFALLVAAAGVFGEPYYCALALGYGLTVLALAQVAATVERWTAASALVLCSLLLSRAFIDYSSSGLENPLTHALLGTYVWLWLRLPGDARRTFALTLVASGLFLSRPDAIVLIAPSLAGHLWEQRSTWRRHAGRLALGAAPAGLWLVFSLLYYGALAPNTALAKVGTGLGWQQHATQAWHYVHFTLTTDFATAALVLGAVAAGALGGPRLRPLAGGLVLWLAYLTYVGADYMAGRFFSGPALLSSAVIAVAGSGAALSAVRWALGGAMLVNLGALSYTLLSPADYHRQHISDAGIADERGYYYQALGLVPSLTRKAWIVHPWLFEGNALRSYPGWYARCAIGMVGYSAGPEVRWVDPLALTDPFLARLPSRANVRVGHYERAFPQGYLDSLLSGKNAIVDPGLAALYADVDAATRAPLWGSRRIGAIYRLNTGHHARASRGFEREAIGLPGVPVQTDSPLSCFGLAYGWDGSFRIEGPPARAVRIFLAP
ncbi:MAG: hypothetical protein KF718_22700 [Polyangiaceae bacterium]|nr:hypothetical protein [Polyangiaceae bacterium]